jgi:hypothetical protein
MCKILDWREVYKFIARVCVCTQGREIEKKMPNEKKMRNVS